MDLFSDGLITIIFGDGPLGFRVGETQFGHPVISGFTEKDDSSYFPIYVGYAFSAHLLVFGLPSNWKSHSSCERC